MELQVSNISPNNLEQCIKCTICTVYCPVLSVNPDYPGPKQAGPDGERYRLKDPEFYDKALKMCLNCKRCEVACPSGVKIGDIIQMARIKYDHHTPPLRDRMLASTDEMGSMATLVAPIVNTMLRLSPVKAVMDATVGIDKHRTFPAYASRTFTSWFKHKAPDQSQFKNRVSYFHGCYVNYNNPSLGRDFVSVMNAIGYGVDLLEKERCCGVAKIANKLIKQATRDAKTNIASITKAVDAGNMVLGTSSTCIFTMRDEYPHLLNVDNSNVRSSISLATKFIHELVDSGKVKLVFRPDFKLRLTYHIPCHMQRMGWAIHSLELLKMIPGVELVPIESSCCGISGTYGFKKENYRTSQAVGKELFDSILAANVDVVATDCETCKWQIEMSTGVTVENPVTILAHALDLEATRKANN
ncbi:MAG: anaerobic glycerol-3-phosphate dehydrogenase subunit GlpC [Firmicutes bacterium]|nr:anaerobic glycerol-3-phosphate dehydrogenase subunit GlpC [Bacillota bacterium]MCM1401487.1 anaerobic glycerol-3-phosphate dehydrogenase subunit GlpC [Bacteroides sp.]MCM1477422.1 anaerobic glycerol-3-phosphate dehydrogenase subunit GlpC [Bacteroides sp.]